jgi:hypothetical protein
VAVPHRHLAALGQPQADHASRAVDAIPGERERLPAAHAREHAELHEVSQRLVLALPAGGQKRLRKPIIGSINGVAAGAGMNIALATDLRIASGVLAHIIDAQEALPIGLVNRVVPAEQLEQETLKLAERLAQGPTVAYGQARQGSTKDSACRSRTFSTWRRVTRRTPPAPGPRRRCGRLPREAAAALHGGRAPCCGGQRTSMPLTPFVYPDFTESPSSSLSTPSELTGSPGHRLTGGCRFDNRSH